MIERTNRYLEWGKTRGQDFRSNGIGAIKRTVHDAIILGLRTTAEPMGFNYGTPIYESDWNLLLILDACRYDLIQQVQQEFDFLTNIQKERSCGSSSKEWFEKNFSDDYIEEMRQTAMITGNPFSAEVLDPENFEYLNEVWRNVWDDSLQTIPPRPITDRLIAYMRNRDTPRVIAHYMQPHAPFIDHPELTPGDFERDIWREILRGRRSKGDIWAAYRDNLRIVLDDVRLVLSNVDAERVIITADHGNAVGEWGIYGHPERIPFSAVREIPWAKTEAKNSESYQPDIHLTTDSIETDIESRLADLGYIESTRGET